MEPTQLQLYLDVVHAHTPPEAVIGLTTIKAGFVHNRWYQRRFVHRLIEDAHAVEQRANVFVRITPLAKAPEHGRGLERHSIGASVLFVDYDTYASQPDGIATLEALPYPPSMIVSSGSGLHAYWLLDRLYTDLDRLKAANKQLALDISAISQGQKADSCYDLARILRAPGTWNIKRDPATPCEILALVPERIYTLETFPQAELADDAITIEVWDQEPLSPDFLETVREKDRKLAARIMSEERAKKADAPVNSQDKVDRSRNDAYIVTRLLALGYRPQTCMSVLMSPEWFSGSKFRETGRFDYVVMTVNEMLKNWQASPDRYFAKSTFQPEQLGSELHTAGRYIFVAERLWRYQNGVYVDDAKAYVRDLVARRLGRRWQSRYADETVKWLQDTTAVEWERLNNAEGLINCLNGMLNTLTGELFPHDPAYLSTVQLPIHWTPDADTTAIDRFMSQVLPADAIPVFWEYLGSAFILNRYWPKAFITLVGPADSGKSKVIELVGRFFGRRDGEGGPVSSMSLQTLADSRFTIVKLIGRIANVFSDLDEAEAQNCGQIKALTGDDPISGEQKFGGVVNFKNTARLFFSSNFYPSVRNPDEAYFVRAHIIECKNRFKGAAADPEIVNKLSTPANLAGMLVRVVEGQRRLLQQGEFTHSPSIAHGNLNLRFHADTVSGFLRLCEPDETAYIPKQQFYDLYAAATKRQERKPVSADKFYKRLADTMDKFSLSEEYKTIDGQRVWCYCGLRPITTPTVHLNGMPYMVLN